MRMTNVRKLQKRIFYVVRSNKNCFIHISVMLNCCFYTLLCITGLKITMAEEFGFKK